MKKIAVIIMAIGTISFNTKTIVEKEVKGTLEQVFTADVSCALK